MEMNSNGKCYLFREKLLICLVKYTNIGRAQFHSYEIGFGGTEVLNHLIRKKRVGEGAIDSAYFFINK